MSTDVRLCRVRLIGTPVAIWGRSRDWFEGLLRELDIIATGADAGSPRELVHFVANAREEFSRFTAGSASVLEAAEEHGETTVDLEMHLPANAAVAARELWDRIVAADNYCRQGDLLTLALPQDVRVFVRWYLEEIANQIEGGEPRPWASVPQPRSE